MEDAVLVTGAGGFVGSAAVRSLVPPAAEPPPTFGDGRPVGRVIALLRPGGSRERLRDLPDSERFRVEEVDLTDLPALGALLAAVRPRAVVHTALDRAAYEGLGPAGMERLILAPLRALVEGLAPVTGARLIHAGSAWVLGSGARLDEAAEVRPRSPYARAKAEQDAALPALAGSAGVGWINLRMFNIFGRHESPARLLPYLVSRLARGQVAELSHGDQVRDFNDVDAMAQGFRLALEAGDDACGAVYHLGSGHGTTLRDFAGKIAASTGNADLIRFGASVTRDQDLPCLVADPSRARRVLGWVPEKDLDARVRDVVHWWLDRLPGRTTGPQRVEPGPA